MSRLKFVGGLFGTVRAWVWAVMVVAFAALAVLQQVREELPTPSQGNLYVRAWIPDWEWPVWVIVVLVVVLLLVVEASYRMHFKRDEFTPPDAARWDVLPLEPVIGKTFTQEAVVIDRKRFMNCNFTRVTLLYKGTGPFSFDGSCKLTPPISIRTDHPAASVFMGWRDAFVALPGITVDQGLVDPQGNRSPIKPVTVHSITVAKPGDSDGKA